MEQDVEVLGTAIKMSQVLGQGRQEYTTTPDWLRSSFPHQRGGNIFVYSSVLTKKEGSGGPFPLTTDVLSSLQ